jgi:3-hydroxybutyryl-CoA dehydrogenase
MPENEGSEPVETGLVVVVGAGLMGAGIAQVFAVAGHEVALTDTDGDCLTRVPDRLAAQLRFLVDQGLLTGCEAAAARERVRLSEHLRGALEQTPLLVVDAISEDLALKQDLFRSCDRATPPSTILASNSSGLSISAMAVGLDFPERLCGAHFWNPPHLIPLVEVVFGEQTTEHTVEKMSTLLRGAGKVPVAVRRDVPGFVGNRLLHALQREAMYLVDQGVASAEDVDLVVTQGFGRRLGAVGPLAVCDLAGLDLVLEVDSYLLSDLDRSPHPSPLLRRLVEERKLGVKTGEGFHEWSATRIEKTMRSRDEALLQALLRDAGTP